MIILLPLSIITMIRLLRRLSLSQWIVLAMVAGILFGWQFPEAASHTGILSDLFIRLIKCIIVPLIFSTLVIGIAGHTDDMKAVGRLALKCIIYFELVTTLALFIGLAAVNIVKPGTGIPLSGTAAQGNQFAATTVSFDAVMEHLAPTSLFDSAARNDVLQVVIFAIIFGVALGRVNGKPRQTMIDFFEGLAQVMFKFTGIVMCLAPFG